MSFSRSIRFVCLDFEPSEIELFFDYKKGLFPNVNIYINTLKLFWPILAKGKLALLYFYEKGE